MVSVNQDGARDFLNHAIANLRRAERALDTARVRVEDAAAVAAGTGIPQTEIIRATGWSREHVRRLTRASQHRDRVYIGGPLDGQPVRQNADHWEHFRDDDGNPLADAEGDLEWQGHRGRYYYWAVQAPGGLTYVHLTRMNQDGSVRKS